MRNCENQTHKCRLCIFVQHAFYCSFRFDVSHDFFLVWLVLQRGGNLFFFLCSPPIQTSSPREGQAHEKWNEYSRIRTKMFISIFRDRKQTVRKVLDIPLREHKKKNYLLKYFRASSNGETRSSLSWVSPLPAGLNQLGPELCHIPPPPSPPANTTSQFSPCYSDK